jgi:MFS family permease
VISPALLLLGWNTDERAPRPCRLRASLEASVAEGAAAEVFGACAGGAVLTGWALFLGASPFLIGVLMALPVAAQVVQLPAAWLTQRFGPKRLAIAAIGASRLAWLPLVAVPFVHLPQRTALGVFVTVVAITAVLGVVGSNAWTAWMGDLVPGMIRGRFFGRRLVFVNIAGTTASLAAGIALDFFSPLGWRGETLAALGVVAGLAGMVSIALLVVQQGPAACEEAGAADWRDAVGCARDPRTRPLLLYLLGWNAAVGISAGFFTYHMLVNLKMGFVLVAAYGILVAAVRVVSAPAWGRLVDGFGARPVLIVCSFGIAVVPLVWLGIASDRLWPIAIEAVVAGALWGGHGIATFDLSIGLSPRKGRPFYLAVFATAGGLGFAATSALAGLVLTTLAPMMNAASTGWRGVHVLFLLSAVGRAGAAWLALRLDEPSARSVRDVVGAIQTMVARGASRLQRARTAAV